MKNKYNNPYGHIKSGRIPELNNQYVRSMMEANICLYFEWLKKQNSIIDWEYEPCRFTFPTRTTNIYTPDFFVRWRDGKTQYVEVKGFFKKSYDQGRTKLKRFKKYYPEMANSMMLIYASNKTYSEFRKIFGDRCDSVSYVGLKNNIGRMAGFYDYDQWRELQFKIQSLNKPNVKNPF